MIRNCGVRRLVGAVRGTAAGTLAAGAAVILGLAPQAGAEGVSFEKDIKPILEERCFQCHGAEKQKGELRLDSQEMILKGGETHGASIVAGKPEESPLYTLIVLPADDPDIMPAKGDPLTEAQAKLIHDWIAAGAAFGAAPAPEAPAGGVSFGKDIWPVLMERCISCHGPEKQKGEYRLDSPEAILKGGEHHGASIVAGKPEESPLLKLISLPADDVDIMPAKGDPLTPEQIAAITTWITEGANFGEWNAEVAAADLGAGEEEEEENILEVLAMNTEPAAEAQLAAVSDLGGLAMPLDMKTPLVRVDYHLVGDQIEDGQMLTLPPLADQLTWLNLAGTKITDAGLAAVAGLPKLTRLHLERTGITDAGLAHVAGLEHLEYLNLYGTKVTDAGLEHLKGLKKLKKLFLWQTEVTKDGVAALKEALPKLQVDMGLDPDAIPATELAKVIPVEMFTADSCCAKAAAENKVCEHPCCEEARKAGTVCTKCNAGAEELLAIVAKFDEDSCCAKAYAGGKLCDHDCCKEAWAAKKVCAKCNPKGAAPAPEGEPKKLAFDDGSCCGKAAADGKECEHPCCVEARAAGKICEKCNPKAAAAAAEAEGEPAKLAFDNGSCCGKAAADGKECEHPCCVEARAAGKICAKCNPKAAAAAAEAEGEPAKLTFDEGSCCAKAQAEGKACEHPCCVEAQAAGKVCAKCNPKAGAAPEKAALKFNEGSCCDKAQKAGGACEHPCCVEAAAANTVCEKCNPKAA